MYCVRKCEDEVDAICSGDVVEERIVAQSNAFTEEDPARPCKVVLLVRPLHHCVVSGNFCSTQVSQELISLGSGAISNARGI